MPLLLLIKNHLIYGIYSVSLIFYFGCGQCMELYWLLMFFNTLAPDTKGQLIGKDHDARKD